MAISMLASGEPLAHARTIEVERSTVYRWLQDPGFQVEMNREKREALDSIRERMRSLAANAPRSSTDRDGVRQ